jgi:hypothetical protein
MTGKLSEWVTWCFEGQVFYQDEFLWLFVGQVPVIVKLSFLMICVPVNCQIGFSGGL